MTHQHDGTGDDPDDAPWRRPLPPEDRVWRHPSELAADASSTRTPNTGRRVVAGVGLVAAAGVAAVSVLGSGTQPDVDIASDKAALTAALTPATQPDSSYDTWAAAVALAASTTTATLTAPDAAPGTEPLAVAVATDLGDHLMTSTGAIGDHEVLEARFSDGSTTSVIVIGRDPVSDVAVVFAIGAAPGATSAGDTSVELGERVAVIDPVGGPISALVTEPRGVRPMGDDWLVDVIGIDTELGAIPPGTPVADADGTLIGMIAATDRDQPGVVIPIDTARSLALELIDTGYASHARIGVTTRDASESVDEQPAGAEVTAVESDGPAAEAGLRIGDIVTSAQGRTIESAEELVSVVRGHDPGDLLVLGVERDGEPDVYLVYLGTLGD